MLNSFQHPGPGEAPPSGGPAKPLAASTLDLEMSSGCQAARMFLTCSHYYAISDPARVGMCATDGGGNAASLPKGASQHGRREVIRERMSSRHCEEPNNADGPPDGASRRKPAAPEGPRSPRGEPGEPPQSLPQRRYGT